MQKEFYILIGRSGAGKSTIAKLLLKDLQQKVKDLASTTSDSMSQSNISRNYDIVKHISTGKSFRAFINKDNWTSNLTKDLVNKGHSAPEFLSIWSWVESFIKKIQDDNTFVILDGAPRRMIEAQMIIEACKFYQYKSLNIIYLNVDEKTSRERILARNDIEKREDDNKESLKEKNKWFDSDVLPIIDYYKNLKIKNLKIKVFDIAADGAIENVWLLLQNSIK